MAVVALAGCARNSVSPMFVRGGPAPWTTTARPLAAPTVIAEPIPEAALVAYAPAGEGPYRLDSGDKLRVVVFGQEGL